MRKLGVVLSVVALLLLAGGGGVRSAWAADLGVMSAVMEKVNINTAGVAELTTIKGIGEKIAQAIVDYRDNNGPFHSVEDLLKVKGIGEKKLAVLREFVVTE